MEGMGCTRRRPGNRRHPNALTKPLKKMGNTMTTGDIEAIAKREHFVNMMMKNMTEMKIAVVGVGGAGSNVISTVHSGCKNNVHTVAINTDEAALQKVSAHTKLLVGKDVTQGKGTNGFPEVGEYCGECAKEAIRESIKGKDLVFVIAGMGGGTGTGIAPIVTKISKESKAITIVVAINPFSFEKERSEKAKIGVQKLKAIQPNTFVVENDALVKSAENLPLSKAFGIIDRKCHKDHRFVLRAGQRDLQVRHHQRGG